MVRVKRLNPDDSERVSAACVNRRNADKTRLRARDDCHSNATGKLFSTEVDTHTRSESLQGLMSDCTVYNYTTPLLRLLHLS